MKNWPSRPDNGRPNLFPFYQQIIWSLGGVLELIPGEVSTKRTGRRDPDIKPRSYPLNDKWYGMDPKTGTIWRRP
jgi:hypothetical protein